MIAGVLRRHRTRTLSMLAVVCLVAVAGCSSGDGTRSAPTTPSIATPTTPLDPLGAIRTAYATELSDGTPCSLQAQPGLCIELRDNTMRSIGQSARDLPSSREKSDFIVAVDNWNRAYQSRQDALCLGNTTKLGCAPLVPDTYWHIVRLKLNMPGAQNDRLGP